MYDRSVKFIEIAGILGNPRRPSQTPPQAAICTCSAGEGCCPLTQEEGLILEGVVAAFAGTDSYGIVYVVDEDFAITVGTGVYLVNGKVYYLLGSFV